MKGTRAGQIISVLVALFPLMLLGPGTSSATASAIGQVAGPDRAFCNHNLDTGVSECFGTRAEQLASRNSTNSVWVLSAYNWIDFNPGGGVYDFYRSTQCTTTVADIDYPASASDPTGRNLQEWFYPGTGISLHNTISSVATPGGGGCDVKLWDYNNYGAGGAISPWIHSCSHLGDPDRPGCPSVNWYDRAGSFKLS